MEMERALYIAIAVDDDDGVAAVLPLPPSGQHHHRSITVDVLVESLAFDFHAFLARLLEANGGGGLAPASAAAVAGLEKKVFHAIEECGGGVTECAICLQEFEDGEEVSVMPCSRGHEFHTSCITKWLGRSNSCPLCRRALPTAGVDGQ